ncbi:LL-diaminopimelate aminotransferase [Halolamina pelagica]|uniref:LL-diaminopimelate aminotransferase n=1 Tax=Halolamina pelagica TaxID=699431 RepID=A0A0P7GA14_9EURY|nr:LL-diaminopimelate aminotransferase [Halolamina pelagica]
MDTFTEALDAAGAEYTRPDGAFYVMARFDDYPGTMANVKRLIDEAGVAGMPGEGFGEAYSDWLRFALVTPASRRPPTAWPRSSPNGALAHSAAVSRSADIRPVVGVS